MSVRGWEQRGVLLTPKLVYDSAKPLDAEALALLQNHKPELLKELIAPNTLPRLPWQLDRLVQAASSDLLPQRSLTMPEGFVTDLNRYVMAWGCSYLTGDRDEALRRLWRVHSKWQQTN